LKSVVKLRTNQSVKLISTRRLVVRLRFFVSF
jgi:hypothetical protein